MARQRTFTPTQLVLYTSLVPVAAIGFTLLAMSLLRSNGESAPTAPPSRAELAAQSASDERREARRAFRECMENMGGDVRQPRFRGRFSPRPDYSKIREAATVCQSLLGGGGWERQPTAEGPSSPPIA